MNAERKQTVMTLVLNAAILLVNGTVTEGKKWICDTVKRFHADMESEMSDWTKMPILQKYQKFYNELNESRRNASLEQPPPVYATITSGMSDILFELWREEKVLEISRRHREAMSDYMRQQLKLDKTQVTNSEMMLVAADILDPLAGVLSDLIGQLTGKSNPLKYKSVDPDSDDFMDQYKQGVDG